MLRVYISFTVSRRHRSGVRSAALALSQALLPHGARNRMIALSPRRPTPTEAASAPVSCVRRGTSHTPNGQDLGTRSHDFPGSWANATGSSPALRAAIGRLDQLSGGHPWGAASDGLKSQSETAILDPTSAQPIASRLEGIAARPVPRFASAGEADGRIGCGAYPPASSLSCPCRSRLPASSER